MSIPAIINMGDQPQMRTFVPPRILQGKRILFMIDEMAAITDGGTERQLIQIIKLCKAAGLSPELALLRNTEWLTKERAGCPVHRADVVGIMSAKGVFRLLRLASWIRSSRFEIVHCFFRDSNLVGPLVSRLAGVPVVVTSRRNLNYDTTFARLILQKIANRFTDVVVANCEAVRTTIAAMEKLPLKKVEVIYNGIETDSFQRDYDDRKQIRSELGLKDEDFLVGCISVVRPIKGVDILVEAADRLLSDLPQAHICVVGDGPDFNLLSAITASRPWSARFHWAGAQEDVHPYLSAFDLAVLPSRSEGFSNSILEYFAAGLPVVATDVGGNSEAVIPDVGLLVPPGDAAELSRAIGTLARDGRLEQRSAVARRSARRWDVSTALTRNAHFYAECLGDSSRPQDPEFEVITR